MNIDCRFRLILIQTPESLRVKKAESAFVLFRHSCDCSEIHRATVSKIMYRAHENSNKRYRAEIT